MNELLKIILSLSLSGALLILVLLLCKPLVKDKLSKRWQYYIWLIVVVRLLLPFAPETNLMGTLFHYFDNAIVQTDTSQRPEQEPSALPETGFSDQHNVPGQAGMGDGEQLEPEKAATPGMFEMVKQNIAVLCLLVWLIVAACLLIRKITVYQSFVKYIKAGRIEIFDMQLWERVGKLVEQTDIKGAVGLYTNSLISSPLLIGFFRPCIMLPTTELSESDFEYTILHELTHYKRRDIFYKWLVQVTICFHWFNPIVYLMGREVNRACELSCDEAVIKSLDEGGRRAYGDTLLNAMGMGGNYKDSLASVTLNEGKELLKERLDAIMKFKKTTRLTAAISMMLIFVFCFGATAAGAYVLNDKQIEQNEEAADTITLKKYADYFGLQLEAVNALANNIQKVIPSTPVAPRAMERREVSEGIYIEVWTREEIRPLGRFTWSEILITNGNDDDKKILLKLKTPDLLITNGAITLPDNSIGSVEGLAWTGLAVSSQQVEGEITYITTTFTAQITLKDSTQTFTTTCTMISNAPKGNQYRIGLIHAIWGDKNTQGQVTIPQMPNVPEAPSTITPNLQTPPNITPDMPTKTLLIPISIDKLEAYGVVCVGQINMDKGIKYSCDISADSGQGLFVGLSPSDQISSVYGTLFDLSFGNAFDILSSTVNEQWTVNKPTMYYVYICNGNAETELNNITGSLYLDN